MSTPQAAQLPPAVLEALRKGNKIEAIKLLRESGQKLGLAEAKGLIDALEQQGAKVHANVKVNVGMHRHPATAPAARGGLSPGEMPRSNPTAAIVAVLVIAVVGAYFFLRA